MGYLFEHFGIQEFTKFKNPFLMTGRAKIPALAGKWQEIFVLTVITLDPGKTKMEVAAVQVFINDVQYIRPPITIIPLIPVIPYACQFFKMCFYTPVILVFTRGSGIIYFSLYNTGRYHV